MSSTSPFTQHLHTSYVPSHIESNRLRSLIDDCQKLADTLNKEIDELTKRRDEHARFVENHSALLSQSVKCPTTSFLSSSSHLFRPTHLLKGLPSSPELTQCSLSATFASAGATCHSTPPLLWSVIDIDIPWFPDPREYRINDIISKWQGRMQVIYEMTQLWISRSASCPLTMSFTGGGMKEPDPEDSPAIFVVAARQNIRRIVDALCDVSTRLKSLYPSITIDDDAPGARFFQISPDKIPILQNLSISATHISLNLFRPSLRSRRELTLTMTMGGDLVKAPSLRRLALGRYGHPLHNSRWSGQTSLKSPSAISITTLINPFPSPSLRYAQI